MGSWHSHHMLGTMFSLNGGAMIMAPLVLALSTRPMLLALLSPRTLAPTVHRHWRCAR